MFDDLFTSNGLSVDRCRAFLAIAAAGGITQAASGDPNRQSQLSRQLGDLESWMGAKLVVRGRGKFALTEPGKEFLTLLKTCFSDLRRLKERCAGKIPFVKIGAGESLLQWLVLPALAGMPPIFSDWKWHLQNLRSEKIISCLLEGTLDFGLLRTKQVPKQLQIVEVTKLEHVLIVPPSLAEKTLRPGFTMRLAKLEDGSHLDTILADEFDAKAGREVTIQCTSLAQTAEAVRLGLAAAILPKFVKIPNLAKCCVAPLRGTNQSMSLWLTWHPRTDAITPQFANFRKVFQSTLRHAADTNAADCSG